MTAALSIALQNTPWHLTEHPATERSTYRVVLMRMQGQGHADFHIDVVCPFPASSPW